MTHKQIIASFVALFAITVALCFIYPTEPCITITHLNSDSMGERYTVEGNGWSGYMVTDRPVSVWGDCGVEVRR